jgi:quinoprotein relay system zinc metallohydrolase 2
VAWAPAAASTGIALPRAQPRRTAAAFAATVYLASPLGAHGAGPETFALQEIAAGVYVHPGKALALDAPGHDDIANIGFVIGTRCVAVVDSGGSVRIGRALRAAIARHTRLPVCYVINTHVHVDHVLGNAAFTADKPQFVGHADLSAALTRSRDFFLKNYAADLDPPASAAQIIAPGQLVAIGRDLELDLGGRRLILRAWGKAHTDCDLTVYDAKSRTLFSGDLLFVQRTPVLDGSIRGWLEAIDTLATQPAAHVVPGHGAVQSDARAAFAAERAYLEGLLDGVRAQLAQGKPLQEAIRQLQSPTQVGWLLWDETQPRNVARAYQELEWE